jgi:hypothetical protein
MPSEITRVKLIRGRAVRQIPIPDDDFPRAHNGLGGERLKSLSGIVVDHDLLKCCIWSLP